MLRWLMVVFVMAQAAVAQRPDENIITALNVDNLTSVLTIAFDSAPEEVGEIINGWFVLSPDGTRAATMNRDNALWVWDTTTGELVGGYQVTGAEGFPATLLDADFSADGALLAALYTDGSAHLIGYYDITNGQHETANFPNTQGDIPQRLWVYNQPPEVWLEVMSGQPQVAGYVMRLPVIFPTETESVEGVGVPEPMVIASGPETDSSILIRVGRVQPPDSVTLSQGGEVKRWNLETNQISATAIIDSPQPALGPVNASASHLVWRDRESQSLYLLDFETGDSEMVAALNGEYVAFLALTQNADVILGVYPADEPVVIAWDVATGERRELGAYRECTRPPDLVRLSDDGTTLVIGCDTGLDVWRVE